MRILFIGGFLRGLNLIQRLVDRGENVVGAYICQEDPHESPVYSKRIADLCSSRGIPAEICKRIAGTRAEEIRQQLAPDVTFCLGWRTLLPRPILTAAPRGIVAVHDSLLPRMRGFAPTNWGLLLGEPFLGATLFQMTEGVDDGVVYFQESFAPSESDTVGAIQQQLSTISTKLFEKYLDAVAKETLIGRPQAHDEATYCCARNPDDGEIDWTQSATTIARQIRALASPSPGSFTHYQGELITVVTAIEVMSPPAYAGRVPGRIVAINRSSGDVDVLCGSGILRISMIRRAAGQEIKAAEFCRSVRGTLGLNVSREIGGLRDIIRALELRVDQLESNLDQRSTVTPRTTQTKSAD